VFLLLTQNARKKFAGKCLKIRHNTAIPNWKCLFTFHEFLNVLGSIIPLRKTMLQEKRPKRDAYTRSFKPKQIQSKRKQFYYQKKIEGLLTQASCADHLTTWLAKKKQKKCWYLRFVETRRSYIARVCETLKEGKQRRSTLWTFGSQCALSHNYQNVPRFAAPMDLFQEIKSLEPKRVSISANWSLVGPLHHSLGTQKNRSAIMLNNETKLKHA